MNNIHNQSIPTEVLTQATAKMNEVYEILKPYLLTLSPDERHSLLKKGDKSSNFVDKALEFSRTNPEFLPSYVTRSDFEIDAADSNNLLGIVTLATQLCNGLDDTMMVAGSEALYAALAYYNSVRQAAALNVPGAKAIYEELKKRFISKSRTAVTASAVAK